MLLTARAARYGSAKSQASISAALWIMSPARVARTRAPTAFAVPLFLFPGRGRLRQSAASIAASKRIANTRSPGREIQGLPAACSKDGEQFSDHVLPAMYDLYPGACTHFQAFQRTTPMKRLAILVILVVLATFALVLAAGGP